MKRKQKIEQEIKRYKVSTKQGLSSEQVKERIEEKLTNKAKIKSSHSYFSIIMKNTCTFFNLIWLILALALVWVQAYQDLLFLIVIVLNTLIAIVQEIRAKITVEKLSLATSPDITVIRNKEEVLIKGDDIVLDDIIILNAGEQIPADCTILEGNIEVNESLLTGESVPVKKCEGDNLFSGSYIVSGKCYSRVEKVGAQNYIQTIAQKAKQFKAPSSNLFRDLSKLIKIIGIVLIPLGIATFFKEYFKDASLSEVVSNTSGAITGMIPAGMFLLITIALSVGVIKLAKKKTLVKDIYSIEMLARTDVLCLDKTGTITDGTMNVHEVINMSKSEMKNIDNIMMNILYAQRSGNHTSAALTQYFTSQQTMIATKTTDFSSSRKFSVTTFENGKTYYLGAPTFTNYQLSPKEEQILNDQMREGLRVVALIESDEEYDEEKGANGQKLLAFITIEDHIRPDAYDTIKWFKDNDVKIKIISGDDPITVSKIAERVNVEGYDKCISLENMSLDDVEQLADLYTVFGRVSPEQKYTLVKALKAKGHVVAMTGDGVNDTLALKEADCSIAMADGSEVARNISKLVLMDSNFASLPAVVKEGRQVVNNVQNSSVLFLMKTLFTILLCTLTLLLAEPYPFSPKNLFMLELFVIGIPSFLLTFEPNDKLIKGNFIPQVLKKSLPRVSVLLLAVVTAIYAIPNLTVLEIETIPTFALTIAGFINLIWLCLPFNWYRGLIAFISAFLTTLAMCVLPTLFTSSNLTDIAGFRPVVWYALIGIEFVLVLLIIAYIFISKAIRKSMAKPKKKHRKKK